jgi:hypothetical protein
MTLKYTNIFHFKALQNLPKLGFLVWKYTIWQPCCKALNFPKRPGLTLDVIAEKFRVIITLIDKTRFPGSRVQHLEYE